MCPTTIEAATNLPNTSASTSAADGQPPNKIASIGDDPSSFFPFDPDKVSPLQWWRTMPADRLGDAQHLLLRATLEHISTIDGHEWLIGLHNNAAVSVAVALSALPITEINIEIDLAMSALTVSALGGSAGATHVLSHILRLAPLDRLLARQLSVSWLRLNLRRALKAKVAKEGDAFKARHASANRDAGDRRTATYAGDFS